MRMSMQSLEPHINYHQKPGNDLTPEDRRVDNVHAAAMKRSRLVGYSGGSTDPF